MSAIITRGMTIHDLIREGWKLRLVRWDGYHEHHADVPIDAFLRALGFALAKPAQQASEEPK